MKVFSMNDVQIYLSVILCESASDCLFLEEEIDSHKFYSGMEYHFGISSMPELLLVKTYLAEARMPLLHAEGIFSCLFKLDFFENFMSHLMQAKGFSPV